MERLIGVHTEGAGEIKDGEGDVGGTDVPGPGGAADEHTHTASLANLELATAGCRTASEVLSRLR